MLDIFRKNIFGSQPGWRKEVAKNGQPAKAVVLENPKDYFKRIPQYRGAEV